MKLSIIVPCYNTSSFLEKCFNSLVFKDSKDWEVILINDGSNDDTADKINQIQKSYNGFTNIITVHNENNGISSTRNEGIDLAKGEFICFVDSDDWVSNDYFDKLLSLVSRECDLGIVSYNRVYQNTIEPRIFNLNGKYTSEFIKRRIIGLIESELSDPSQADSIVTVWGKIFKTSIIKENKISFISTKEVGSGEDLLFCLEYVSHCTNEIQILDEPLYQYRKTNISSFTTKYRSELFLQWQKLFTKINQFVKTEIEQCAFHNRISLGLIGLGLNEINNPKGLKIQLKNIKIILNNPLFQSSLKKLKIQYLPLHWKVFFITAKYKKPFALRLLLKAIAKIINK